MGSITSKTLIWREGMLEWQPLRIVNEFSGALVNSFSEPFAHGHPQSSLPGLDEPALADAISFLEEHSSEEKSEYEISFPIVIAPEVSPTAGADVLSSHPIASLKPISRNEKWIYAIAGVFVLIALVSWGITYWARQSLPNMPGLADSAIEQLKAAAFLDLKTMGPSGALAVSRAGSEASLYVSSNLPDGAEVEVRASGLADTLLEAFDIQFTIPLKIKRHMARTPVLRREDGKPLPKGEYDVQVTYDGKVLARQTLFLGGVKDSEYAKRLKTYQASLRLQVEAELDEIRQLTESLDGQLTDTSAAFLRGIRGWSEFHSKWTAFQKQFDLMFAEWTPQALKQEFYYGALYKAVKESGQAISALHLKQDGYLKGDTSPNISVTQLEAEAEKARHLLTSVRAKLAQIQRLGANENGLPKRITHADE